VRIDNAEGESIALVSDDVAERPAVAHAFFPKALGQGDRIAVEIEDETGDTISFDRADSARNGNQHSSGSVSCIKFAVDNLVANRRPADLAREHDFNSVFFKEPEFLRDNERGAVGECGKSESNRLAAGMLGFSHGRWIENSRAPRQAADVPLAANFRKLTI